MADRYVLVPMTLSNLSRLRHYSALNISKTTRDIAIVTIERQLEVICVLSNGDISNDLDGPLTRFSRSQHFRSRMSQKRCVLRTKLL